MDGLREVDRLLIGMDWGEPNWAKEKTDSVRSNWFGDNEIRTVRSVAREDVLREVRLVGGKNALRAVKLIREKRNTGGRIVNKENALRKAELKKKECLWGYAVGFKGRRRVVNLTVKLTV